MVQRPDKIRVGPHDFKIIWQKEIDGGRFVGQVSLKEMIMRFDETMPAQRTGETMIHEIQHAIHGIWCDLALGEYDVDLKEERLTSLEAYGWAQVIRDNPGTMRYITRCLTRKG